MYPLIIHLVSSLVGEVYKLMRTFDIGDSQFPNNPSVQLFCKDKSAFYDLE